MTSYFKFSLGDMVYAKVAIADSYRWADIGQMQMPLAMMVIGRMLTETAIGVDYAYKLGMAEKHMTGLESELVSIDDFDLGEWARRAKIGNKLAEKIALPKKET